MHNIYVLSSMSYTRLVWGIKHLLWIMTDRKLLHVLFILHIESSSQAVTILFKIKGECSCGTNIWKKNSLTVCNLFLQGTRTDKSLEIKTWYDLALLYLRMSQWKDAELCISKIKAISPYSPLACHATGDVSILL